LQEASVASKDVRSHSIDDLFAEDEEDVEHEQQVAAPPAPEDEGVVMTSQSPTLSVSVQLLPESIEEPPRSPPSCSLDSEDEEDAVHQQQVSVPAGDAAAAPKQEDMEVDFTTDEEPPCCLPCCTLEAEEEDNAEHAQQVSVPAADAAAAAAPKEEGVEIHLTTTDDSSSEEPSCCPTCSAVCPPPALITSPPTHASGSASEQQGSSMGPSADGCDSDSDCSNYASSSEASDCDEGEDGSDDEHSSSSSTTNGSSSSCGSSSSAPCPAVLKQKALAWTIPCGKNTTTAFIPSFVRSPEPPEEQAKRPRQRQGVQITASMDGRCVVHSSARSSTHC
jgi:hypothetical protein